MSNNVYEKYDVKVIDAFIDKFARKYIEQRSQSNADISLLNQEQLFKNSGFDTALLEEIISRKMLLIK